MPRAMVIGSPIDHSLSPVLHTAGYEALGLTQWSYGRRQVVAAEMAGFLESLPADVVGVSVTMPDKEAALALADESSALAREVGAANTLVRCPSGWFADNTDVAGVLHALLDAGCSQADSAVVVGAGATARSVVAAVAQLGVRQVTFLVRSSARPETVELAEAYDMTVRSIPLANWGDPETVAVLQTADLLIATTPAHGADALAEVLARALVVDAGTTNENHGHAGRHGPTYVFDVVYADWPTRLAAAAQEHGATVVSGLDMLIHQAAVQFEMFTGHAAPISDMKAAGVAAVE